MNRDTILLASKRFKSLVPNVQQPQTGGQVQSEEGGPGSGRHRTGLDRWTAHQQTTVPGTSVPSTDITGTTVPKFEAGPTPQPQMPGQAPPTPPKPGEAPQGAKPVPDNAEQHGQFAYGLGMQSVQDAQSQLQQHGYRLVGTSAHMGDSLVHTYAHPEGHTIEIHSDDGNMVSGIEYKIPKPSKPQNPGANVFQANAGPKQEGLAPAMPGQGQPVSQIPAVPGQSGNGWTASQQAADSVPKMPDGKPAMGLNTQPKQEMPAYQGGSFSVTGQGSKSFIPKGVILGPGEQMGGPNKFCGICHTATGTIVHYKGLEICRRCASITPGVTRQSVKK